MLIAVIGFVVLLLLRRKYIRTNRFFQVVDLKGDVMTYGNYYQCKSWIEATNGMEALAGQRNYYYIRRKKF